MQESFLSLYFHYLYTCCNTALLCSLICFVEFICPMWKASQILQFFFFSLNTISFKAVITFSSAIFLWSNLTHNFRLGNINQSVTKLSYFKSLRFLSVGSGTSLRLIWLFSSFAFRSHLCTDCRVCCFSY